MKRVLLAFFFALICICSEAQVLSRIISQAFYSYTNGVFMPGDSEVFVYDNPGYGSGPDNTTRFSSDTTYRPVSSTDFVYDALKLQSFDADTNIIKVVQYEANNAGDSFILNIINYYTYDSHRNMLSDSEIANGFDYTLTYYTYDNNENLLQQLQFTRYTDTAMWQNRFLISNTYDNHGNQLISTSFSWDNILNQWDIFGEDTMLYNTANLITEQITGPISHGALTSVTKTIYAYNNLNEVIGDTTSILNDTGTWQNNNIDVYTYNNLHQMLTDTTSYWSDSLYRKSNALYQQYDAAGMPIMTQFIDFTSDTTWIGVNKSYCTYNEYEQMLTSFEYQWNTSQNLV